MNVYSDIADAVRDGVHLRMVTNANLVRITQLTVDPFDDEDDREILIGDFDRETLIRKLESLQVTTGVIPTRKRRWWQR